MTPFSYTLFYLTFTATSPLQWGHLSWYELNYRPTFSLKIPLMLFFQFESRDPLTYF